MIEFIAIKPENFVISVHGPPQYRFDLAPLSQQEHGNERTRVFQEDSTYLLSTVCQHVNIERNTK